MAPAGSLFNGPCALRDGNHFHADGSIIADVCQCTDEPGHICIALAGKQAVVETIFERASDCQRGGVVKLDSEDARWIESCDAGVIISTAIEVPDVKKEACVCGAGRVDEGLVDEAGTSP